MKNILLLLFSVFILFSCARVGSPVGGPRDSIAPVFLGANIDTTRVNVPRNIGELRLKFDEYIILKEIQKNLTISPPIKKIKKILPSNLATKEVIIQWEDTLQANTTYNFNFGNAIQDFNESNPLSYFNFAFSTGDKIDALYISGELQDALQTGTAEQKAKVIGLYKDSDSVDYSQKPYYITKADEDGYYELNYLSPGRYRLLAFEDENGNSVYDPGKEKVGFQQEVLNLDKSISGLNIKLYPSKKAKRYVEATAVPGGILMLFQGNPERVEVTSLSEKLKDYHVSHAKNSDTVSIWFDAVKQNIGITAQEKLEFSYKADTLKGKSSLFYRHDPKNEMILSNKGGNLLAALQDFKITSNYEIATIDPKNWLLKSDSVTVEPFSAKISASDPYQILVKSAFKEGKKYQLTVPKGSVASYYETTAKSYRFDFETDLIQNYGSFEVRLSNKPASKFWLQLLDASNSVKYSEYTEEANIKFKIVKPGNYYVRILVDNNGNGFWEEADFSTATFAEDAFVFYKVINIKPLWELVEDWDLTDNQRLKPNSMPDPKESKGNKQIKKESVVPVLEKGDQ